MISEHQSRNLSPITEQRRQRPLGKFVPNPKLGLREQVREVMRFFHYSARMENTYWLWIVRYLKFHRRPTPDPSKEGNAKDGWQHPRDLGGADVAAYLAHLATTAKISAATQNQALNAVVFLYVEVLHQPLGELGEFARAARSRPSTRAVLKRQPSSHRLITPTRSAVVGESSGWLPRCL